MYGLSPGRAENVDDSRKIVDRADEPGYVHSDVIEAHSVKREHPFDAAHGDRERAALAGKQDGEIRTINPGIHHNPADAAQKTGIIFGKTPEIRAENLATRGAQRSFQVGRQRDELHVVLREQPEHW